MASPSKQVILRLLATIADIDRKIPIGACGLLRYLLWSSYSITSTVLLCGVCRPSL